MHEVYAVYFGKKYWQPKGLFAPPQQSRTEVN